MPQSDKINQRSIEDIIKQSHFRQTLEQVHKNIQLSKDNSHLKFHHKWSRLLEDEAKLSSINQTIQQYPLDTQLAWHTMESPQNKVSHKKINAIKEHFSIPQRVKHEEVARPVHLIQTILIEQESLSPKKSGERRSEQHRNQQSLDIIRQKSQSEQKVKKTVLQKIKSQTSRSQYKIDARQFQSLTKPDQLLQKKITLFNIDLNPITSKKDKEKGAKKKEKSKNNIQQESILHTTTTIAPQQIFNRANKIKEKKSIQIPDFLKPNLQINNKQRFPWQGVVISNTQIGTETQMGSTTLSPIKLKGATKLSKSKSYRQQKNKQAELYGLKLDIENRKIPEKKASLSQYKLTKNQFKIRVNSLCKPVSSAQNAEIDLCGWDDQLKGQC